MSDSNSSDDEVPYVGTHMVMGPGRSHIFGIKNEIVKLLPNIVPDIKLPNINLSNIDSVIKPQMDANSIEFNPNDTFGLVGLENIGNTPAGQNASVILKTITTSRVEGLVRFNSSGDLSLAVNLIILGIPN